MDYPTDTMLKYAEMGAQMRLHELDTERQRIIALFPSLNGGSPNWPDPPFRGAKAKEMATVTIPTSVTITGKRRGQGTRGRRMPEAQRKATSLRMRKYWAAKRKAKKQGFVIPSAK